jgi:tRNA(Arg) A34 adenosine deaminase TadA
LKEPTVKALPDDPAATSSDRKWISRAYEIARSAVAHGNHPFGALLVHNGEMVFECENQVVTSKDVTRHAETGLVSRSTAKLDAKILSQSTLYTSTEPCPMCCGAIHWSGISKVVYGVTSSQMAKTIGREYRGIPCREIFSRINPMITIVGPVLEEEGLNIHREFWPKFLG